MLTVWIQADTAPEPEDGEDEEELGGKSYSLNSELLLMSP
jgi:hypothetical protein